jgi:hypothetical protein
MNNCKKEVNMASSSSSAKATSPEFSPTDIASLTNALQCPVGLDPLTQAVTLVPCCHKVNQVAAEKIYGKMDSGSCEKAGVPCVMCRTPVQAYYVDRSFRDIVQRMLGRAESVIEPMVLPTRSRLLERAHAEVKNLPYPGMGGRFVHSSGNWALYDESGDDFCREMTFVSETKGSLIKEIGLFGYKSGKVSLLVKFREIKESLESYLLDYGIVLKCYDIDLKSYQSENIVELRSLFSIIAQNNQIPDEYFSRIREIVERGTC